MKLFLLFFLFNFCDGKETTTGVEQNPDNDIHLADPTIFFHDGIYYLYGTVGGNPNKGFTVYTSTDLKDWEGPSGAKNGYALSKGDAFGNGNFWAPQVFFHKDRFFMAYTADENIAIAESDSPLGPFINPTKRSLEAPVKLIDPFIFIDDDGTKYLYHVRLKDGNRLFVAEISDDFTEIKAETLTACITASEDWENTENVEWPVAEGPAILKRGQLYYFIYSANDFRNPDYAVGYATARHPLGPWEKHSGNPILSRKDIGRNGSGHGDFFFDQEGTLHYVFHTHYSNDGVAPRKTAIVKAGFTEATIGSEKLEIDKESFYYPQVKNE